MFRYPKQYEVEHQLSYLESSIVFYLIKKSSREVIFNKRYHLPPSGNVREDISLCAKSFQRLIDKHFKKSKETIISKNYNI